MNRAIVVAAFLVCWPVAMASADRCIGPKDTSVGPGFGAAAINPATIVFCDDFDAYCLTNWNMTPRVQWPGYPPNPDTTLCTDPTDAVETYVKQSYHWSKPYSGAPQFGMANADYSNSGMRLEGWDGNSGWATLPYVIAAAGNSTNGGLAYGVFNMAGAIGHQFPSSTAVNGTDQYPLVMRYWTNDGSLLGQPTGWSFPANTAFYMELTLDSDRAPTDYTLADGNTDPVCVTENVNRKFPVICQQIAHGMRPPTCPALSTTVHSSLAFGWLAPLDVDPCDVENGRKPTMYHAATFDGLYWRSPRSNEYPGSGNFNYGMQQAMFEMSVKSTTYDIKLIAPVDCRSSGCTNGWQIDTSTATLTRNYTGPFNKIAMGVGMACELDAATGDCVSGTTRTQTAFTYGFSTVYPDRPIVYGGVGNLSTGACCVQTGANAGTCTDGLTEAQCTGVFHGANTTCATSAACCPLPFADADHDGDVDQDDFGAFQVCYTGAAGGVPTGCACFDRNNDGNVDGTDLTSFTNCWTGPNVPWTAALTPSCVP